MSPVQSYLPAFPEIQPTVKFPSSPIRTTKATQLLSPTQIHKHYKQPLANPKLQDKLHFQSLNAARRALLHAQACQNTLQAEEDVTSMHINEAEEYIGLLRARKAIQTQVADAEEQISVIYAHLPPNLSSPIKIKAHDKAPGASSKAVDIPLDPPAPFIPNPYPPVTEPTPDIQHTHGSSSVLQLPFSALDLQPPPAQFAQDQNSGVIPSQASSLMQGFEEFEYPSFNPFALLDQPDELQWMALGGEPNNEDADEFHEADITIRPPAPMHDIPQSGASYYPPMATANGSILGPLNAMSSNPTWSSTPLSTGNQPGSTFSYPIDTPELHHRLSTTTHTVSVPQTNLTGVQQSYLSESSSLQRFLWQEALPMCQGTLSPTCQPRGYFKNAIASEYKSNIDEANKVFIADLANKHAWPSKDMKETMAKEALSQANAKARLQGKPVTDITNVILKKIKHSSSVWCSQLKLMIFNNIYLYGILPSLEQQATMTVDEIVQFMKNAVAALWVNDRFLHQGTDKFGNPAYFNHPVYTIITEGVQSKYAIVM
ncbi:hypothetical protein PILCRDRAFT_12618 [Piloderma croceum F 1598]|uniref:DUF6532 domain-containing protein n=1 Tax=Piloderma croceum (strain F 1598) TaxID=765440 RepID=A0A0C3F9E5_PILCF|nr:hypothetical protein PILCRDRAFT_12618 [Piloderma croceum F 1598]